MTWPFRKRVEPDARDHKLLAAQIEAELNHKAAKRDLERAHRIAAEMRKVRERNHVGQSLQALYDGGKP